MNESAVFPLILGLILILVGIIFVYCPPKGINYLYGYRTFKSMKNEENWNVAQKLSSRYLLVLGIVILVFGVLVYFNNWNETSTAIITFILLVGGILIQFYLIEKRMD